MSKLYNSKDYQNKVDGMVIHLGGYWKPLSALARVLEELGELAEILLEAEKINKQELEGELADIFIISTCIANQYCVKLSGQATLPLIKEDIYSNLDLFLMLTHQASKISRIVNSYDGDKKLKPDSKRIYLTNEIENFHHILFKLSDLLKVNLTLNIENTIEKCMKRDKGRFDNISDPVSEESKVSILKDFPEKFNDKKIWGLKKWDHRLNLKENILTNTETIERYFKIGIYESFDFLIYKLPTNLLIDEIKHIFNELFPQYYIEFHVVEMKESDYKYLLLSIKD
jgi:NTP pyrophosphatase (non-canonical NTP hydrolase)